MIVNAHESLTAETLRFQPPALQPEPLRAFLASHFGIEGELARLRGERDQNFAVTDGSGRRYVLKIASPLEDADVIDFQVAALRHAAAADPDLPIPRQLVSVRGNAVEYLDVAGTAHAVRVLSYVPGVPQASCEPPTLATIRDVGRLQGRVCHALRGFSHAAESHFMPWNILNGLLVSRDLRDNYMDAAVAARCSTSLERLEHVSLPQMRKLPAQVIHNDAHAGNVLCDPDAPATLTGLIDFGDLVRGPFIVDLATSACSYIENHDDPIRVIAELVQGYRECTDVPEQPLRLLYDAVIARSILVVQLLAFRIANADASAETRDVGLPTCLAVLDTLLAIDPADFFEAIRA